MSTYRVVFEGRLAAGVEPSAVRKQLLQLFKGNEEAVKRFFTGRRLVVREGLDRDTALKYKTVFERAGVTVNVLPEAESAPELSMEAPPSMEATPESPVSPGPAAPRSPAAPSVPVKPAKAGTGLNLAAGLVIVMIVASLGLRFWSSNKIDHFVGLDHVATNDDRVAIQANGRIYLTTTTGRLEQVIKLEDFGLSGDVADLEMMSDGSLLLGDLEAKKVVRCDTGTKNCVPVAPSGDFKLTENFKFLADEQHHLLYIADTNNDRLLVEDLEESSCRLATTSSHLSYPNDLAQDGMGNLYLSDTNRFRVIPLQLEGGDVYERERPFATVAGMPASPEELQDMLKDPERLKTELAGLKGKLVDFAADSRHAKPFALAVGPAGNLWVVQLNTMMTEGTLKIMNTTGETLDTVTLAQGAVPVDLVRSGQALLVADEGLERVYAVDAATHLSTEFGDDELREALAGIAASRSHLESFKSLGLVGAILFGLAALVVAVIAKKQGVA